MWFSVLGPVLVRAGDDELTVGGTVRRALLVRLLIDANRPVSAERLIDDLYVGRPPRAAGATLQSHVANLRQVVGGERIRTGAGGYELVVGADELDSALFEREVAEGRRLLAAGRHAPAAEQLEAALARWRGPALGDFAEAPWALAEAARLNELRLQALETDIDALAALGRHGEIISRAEPAVGEHPLRERLWARLIAALYRDGRQAEALRAYGRLRAILADELGLEPSDELKALERAVLDHDPALAATPATTGATGGAVGAAAQGPPLPSGPTLPSGVVTFLLSDIVGSTRLWETAPASMVEALEVHDGVMAAAVAARGGIVLKARGEGDSTFSVFHRASDGAAAAVESQAALAGVAWPADCRLRVRMALHTGEALERNGDYFGRAVNRAARLRAVADGGQVLVSTSTAELIADHLPEGSQLIELGTQELRDLERPETVYLLAGPSPAQVEPESTPGRDRAGAEETGPGGAGPVPAALVLPPGAILVGRSVPRQALRTRLESALQSARQLVLVAGEPGIGKTSLMAMLGRDAYSLGATVLYGRCDEGLGVPYQPFVEALGHLVSVAAESTFDAVGVRRLADLARIVPAVAEHRRWLPTTTSADPESERYLAFGGAAALLQAAAERTPLVLVLDDLHWADTGTLLLLRFLAGTPDPLRLLVVATYRDTEVDSTPALADTLAALRREREVERIVLRGLDTDELIDLMTILTGRPVDSSTLAFGDLLRKETAGNPFFAREVLRHLAETGRLEAEGAGLSWPAEVGPDQTVPESVRDVLARRVARLGDDTAHLLAAAAVIGIEFEVSLLAAATGADDARVLDALEQVEAAALLTAAPGDRFGFRHALIRHTLYGNLSPARRARLHRAVAEALETLDEAEPRPADLAHHWAAAAPPAPDKALHYARAAGDAALTALAPFDAAHWYTRALGLLGRDADATTRADLLIGLGEAQRRAGDPAHRATLADAARLAQGLGDGARLARAVLARHRGFGSATHGVDAERIAFAEEALKLLPDNDSPVRARLLADLSIELTFAGDFPRRKAISDEAVATARRSRDEATLLHVLNTRFMAIYTPETYAERSADSAEALALASRVDDPVETFWATELRACLAVEAASIDEVDDLHTRMLALADLIGEPTVRWVALFERCWSVLLAGDAAASEALAAEAYQLGSRTGQPDATVLYMIAVGAIRWHEGRSFDVFGPLEEAAVQPLALPMAARAWAEGGRLADAARVLTDAAADGFAHLLPAPSRLISLVTWAEVATRVGDADSAAVLHGLLEPFAGQVVFNGAEVAGPVALPLGELAAVLGRPEEAENHLRAAVATGERLRAPFHLARAELALGKLYLTRGKPMDTKRGRELAEQASTRAARYGCGLVEREANAALAAPG